MPVFLLTGLIVCGIFAGFMFFTSRRNFIVGGLVSGVAAWLAYSEFAKPEPSMIVVFYLGAILLGWFLALGLRIFFVAEDEAVEESLDEN